MYHLLLGLVGLGLVLAPVAVIYVVAVYLDDGTPFGYHSSPTHRMLQRHIENHTLDEYEERKQR